MLVSMLVEDMLTDLGHVPVGLASRFEAGMRLAGSETLDLAILDVNLAGTLSFPIADLLTARGVPVIFATGYGAGGLERRFAGFHVMSKPFDQASLGRAIDAASSGARLAGSGATRLGGRDGASKAE